jgi:hypothetical protein
LSEGGLLGWGEGGGGGEEEKEQGCGALHVVARPVCCALMLTGICRV